MMLRQPVPVPEPEPEPEPEPDPEPEPVHVLCLAPGGERLARPFGAQYVHHAVLEFLALAEMVGASPVLLSSGRWMPPEAAERAPLDGAAAASLTAALRESGPLTIGGLTADHGREIAARLVGLDLCALLAAASSLELLPDSADSLAPRGRHRLLHGRAEAEADGGDGGHAPAYHLLFAAWGRDIANKPKKARLDELTRSGTLERLALPLGKRITGTQRDKLYYAGTGADGGPAAEPVLLLSLLQVYDPTARDQHGFPGVLQQCLLVAELPGIPLLMQTLRDMKTTSRPHQGLTPIRPELATVMLNLAQLPTVGGRLLDPFCGSGSFLLLAAQHCGVGLQSIGCDTHLSEAIINATDGDDGATVGDNFTNFNLEQPELIRANVFTPAFRRCSARLYDAIVTDPPYGTRERCTVNPGDTSAATKGLIADGSHGYYIGDYTGQEMLGRSTIGGGDSASITRSMYRSTPTDGA